MHGLLIVAAVFWINLFVLGFFRRRRRPLRRHGANIRVQLREGFLALQSRRGYPLHDRTLRKCFEQTSLDSIDCHDWSADHFRRHQLLLFLPTRSSRLFILLGILYGIGTGLICNLTPLLLTQCFEKHRAIACGVAYSGSTIGSFFWPALLEYLIHQYGLRGSLLIYGAIILHGVLGAILLRPFAKVPQAEADAPKCAQESDRDVLEPLQKCQSVDFQPMHNGSSNLPTQFTG
uniref:Putative monocarboxylate transporter n=1 Tax=Ixodes ricinus TaxID=34613 RepID=V5GYD8_IXORI